MNLQQHMLLLLMEECCEVAQNASKCSRFTPGHRATIEDLSNLEKLNSEYNDLLAIVELLKDEGIDLMRNEALIENKKKRLKAYIQISQNLGALVVPV